MILLKGKSLHLLLILLGVFISLFGQGQPDDHKKLIQIAKFYKDYYASNDPNEDSIAVLKKDASSKLKPTIDFIVETTTSNNHLLSKEFLILPDTTTLKNVFIVNDFISNFEYPDKKMADMVIDSLISHPLTREVLIENYYRILFRGVGNKIKPFDMSDIDFSPGEYNLLDDDECAIFFLECIYLCDNQIWGFMNIPEFRDYNKAYNLISKFPKFNGQPYFRYINIDVPDFIIRFRCTNCIDSFKGYFIDKFYNLLISHLSCLNNENISQKEKDDLLRNSILQIPELFKYSKHESKLSEFYEKSSDN
jgi:hypothetical protein